MGEWLEQRYQAESRNRWLVGVQTAKSFVDLRPTLSPLPTFKDREKRGNPQERQNRGQRGRRKTEREWQGGKSTQVCAR